MNVNMTTVTADLTAATTALSAVSVAFPIAMAAYSMLRIIWLRTNPGKTEADYLTYLQTASQSNIDDSAVILIADGYVLMPDGSWKKS